MTAIVDGRIERSKVCTGCREEKAWSSFWPRKRWPDGSMRLPMSRCIVCERDASAERARRRRERARRDPAYGRDFWERQAVYSRRSRARRRAVAAALVERRVPMAPLREWLVVEKHRVGPGELARTLGIDLRLLNDWIRRQRTIAFDQADEVLCRAGRPDLLHSLWPDV